MEPSHFDAGTMYFAANRYEMDDFAPYIYKTTDYGKTWKKIVTGIPATEFTRAVREDLVRPGLLYAATERSMYVSFDAGEHWQPLKRNLPPVPVHDIALRDDDIVIATMGRGFYAMEGIAALRESDKVTSDATVHLYTPGATYQNEGAVKVQYWLKSPVQPVTVELLDAKGFVVSKASSADTAAAGGRGGRGGGGGRGGFGPPPARVTTTEGMNTYTASFRYPDGVNFRNAIYWAGNGLNGPVGPPGTYTVRLTAGTNAPQTVKVKVLPPAKSTATEADLTEKFNFLVKIRDTVSAANNAVRTVRNVRYKVDSLRKVLKGEQLAAFEKEANVLIDSTRKTEEVLCQTKNEAGQDPLNFPIKLNNQVGAISGFISGADKRPAPQAYEVWNTLTPQLSAQLVRLKKQYALLLPKVNAILKAAGQKEIVPSTDELGAPPPAGPQATFIP